MTTEQTPLSTEEVPGVTIKTVDNGPLQIKGPVRLVDHDANAYEAGRRRVVTGMTCGSCAGKVTDAVEQIPGISDIDIDLSRPVGSR